MRVGRWPRCRDIDTHLASDHVNARQLKRERLASNLRAIKLEDLRSDLASPRVEPHHSEGRSADQHDVDNCALQ